MYEALFRNGKWWVGWHYSDGRFDPIRTHGNRRAALEAAERMNGNPGWKRSADEQSIQGKE